MTSVSPFLEDGPPGVRAADAPPEPARAFEEAEDAAFELPFAETALGEDEDEDGVFDSTGRAEADVYEDYEALEAERPFVGEDEQPTAPRRRIAVTQVPLLAGHRGKPPALILRWNAAAVASPEVDVVVHLHGYSRPWLHLNTDIEPISGLNLAAPDGLDALIAFGLGEFARATHGTPPQRARLILTAHSGGGAPLLRLLAADPHEVYVYDGLYQDATALSQWAASRIQRDATGVASAASADQYMRATGGALRVLYGSGTARYSRAVARAVADALGGGGSPLAPWYRVERTGYHHMEIPRRYGRRLLENAAVDLPNAHKEQLAQHEERYDGEGEQASAVGGQADLELEPLGELVEPEESYEELDFDTAGEEYEDEAPLPEQEVESGEVEAGETSFEAGFEHEAGATVPFPSGAELRVVATTVPDGTEHFDPNASGNPLLDTGASFRSTKLSTNFSVDELAQSGGRRFDRARIDPRLVRCLQAIREHVGRPIRVSSGYRPYLYNVEVYRKRHQTPTRSQHSSGRAADISIRGMSGMEIAKAALDACGTDIGVGVGRDFAHVDVRGRFAVWTYLGNGPESDAAIRELKRYRRARLPRRHETYEDLEALERPESLDELEAPGPPPAAPAAAAGARGPWHVVVAGFDYERSGVDFERIARNRIRLIIRRHATARTRAKAPLSSLIATAPRFVLFDVKSGRVRRLEATAPKGDWVWAEVSRFTPVSGANYSGATTRHVFDQNQSGTMSITDVYAHVRGIGRTEPGSLAELSFFSHGFVGGPILVNSDDMSGSATDRDPNDRDGRMFKDFRAPTMDDAARAEFAGAFAHDAFVWIFGCAFASSPRQVLHQLLRSRRYRETPLGRLHDDARFTFSFTRKQAEDFFRVDTTFFPVRGADGQFPLTFERNFRQIKDYFSGRIATTYAKA